MTIRERDACSLGTSPMIRSYDMGYISTRMMECEDAFSDMGSLKQHLELPPEYAYDDGALPPCCDCSLQSASLMQRAGMQTRTVSWKMQ